MASVSIPEPTGRLNLRIFLVSVAVLFVEMVLIRWLSTEIRIFSYLQNSVLIAAFLGLGIGCHKARSPVRILPALGSLALIGLAIRDPFGWHIAEGVTQGIAAMEDEIVWYRHLPAFSDYPYVRTALVSFSVGAAMLLLAAVAATFYPFGQRLGLWLDQHPSPIAAYSVNIFGSLVGIGLFDLATVARTPPVVWMVACSAGVIWLTFHTNERRVAKGCAAVVAAALPLLVWSGSSADVTWSPYQKLELGPLENRGEPDAPPRDCGREIVVNNVGYQSMIDLDRDHMRADPETYPPHEIPQSHYVLPYTLLGTPSSVLIVGAGSGNDATGALEAGAESVTAVEIDPVIIDWGREYHPNTPYASDRVEVVLDDARAFFNRDTGPYDLVWFGLLDSHTNPSAFANVRLDHFVYTRESFADMKELLADNGAVVLYFGVASYDARARFIADRLALLLGETFGAMPVGLDVRSSTECLGFGGLMMIGGPPQVVDTVRRRLEMAPDLAAGAIQPDQWVGGTIVTTDDWPYLYLEYPSIPKFHFLIGLLSLLAGVAYRRRLFVSEAGLNLPMFLMGAGFMLLEVTAVSRASLLFGTTWKVNAYVVGIVLLLILLANLVASRVKLRIRSWPFAGLAICLVALGVLPTDSLAALSMVPRVIVGGTFLAIPVFFSGLIFVVLWTRTERKDLALGSNLLGSLVGGVASMLTILVGFSVLIWITLGIYLLVVLVVARQRGTE